MYKHEKYLLKQTTALPVRQGWEQVPRKAPNTFSMRS